MKGLELAVAQVLHDVWKESYPDVVRDITWLVASGEPKSGIMEAVARGVARRATRGVKSGWMVDELSQVVDYIIHKSKVAA